MTRLKNLVVKLAALVTGLVLVLSAQAQTATYFHNDMAGTPMVATDASGTIVWKESYQPYGERLHRQAAGATNKIWFAGKPQDANTGLTYMGARYYDPVVGRFMGVDPVGFDPNNIHSVNRYAYANNNPYKFADPDGRSPALIVNLALRALAWVGARQAGAVAVAEVAAGAATGAMVPGVAVEAGAAKAVGSLGAKEVTKAAESSIKQVNPKNLISTQTRSEMSGSQIKRLEKDMEINGFDQSKPVDAIRRSDGRLEIQDGHHRVEAATRAGIGHIPVQIWEK